MSLRVMTYNVLNGGTGRESLLLEVLRAAVPDIVCRATGLGRSFRLDGFLARGRCDGGALRGG